MLWASWLLGILILFIIGQVLRSSWIQKNKLSELNAKCADLSMLHILLETEFGLVQDSVDCVTKLMDNAACPTQLAVHVLEPVTSIKAIDIFGPELEKSCKLAPNYSTHFKENIFIHKVHRTRNLSGYSAMKYLIEHLQKTLRKQDIIVWIPSTTRMTLHWDTGIRNDFIELKKRNGQLLSYPLQPIPSSHRDIERFFLPEQKPIPSFFALRDDYIFEALPMSRPGVTPALGISFRHPLAATVDVLKNLTDLKIDTDLALTLGIFSLGYLSFHGSSSIGFRFPHNYVTNKQFQLNQLYQVQENIEDEIFIEWCTKMAIQIQENNITIYGRSYMGMTQDSSLQEILVKYGSEAAFETEKEALQYG